MYAFVARITLSAMTGPRFVIMVHFPVDSPFGASTGCTADTGVLVWRFRPRCRANSSIPHASL